MTTAGRREQEEGVRFDKNAECLLIWLIQPYFEILWVLPVSSFAPRQYEHLVKENEARRLELAELNCYF